MAIVRWIGIIVFALISAGRVHAQADPLIQVGFTNLMAGQFNVGYQNVTEYEMPPYSLLYTTGWYGGQTNDPTNWYGPGAEGLWAYQQQHPAPVIWGPFSNGGNPIYHLLDDHHRIFALYRLSTIYTAPHDCIAPARHRSDHCLRPGEATQNSRVNRAGGEPLGWTYPGMAILQRG